MDLTVMVVLVIALAFFFDFTNGFHDTANAMATPIATGAIKPKTAVALSAVLNLVGAFLSTEVARTISGGLIREGSAGVQITPVLIFAGLLGAVLWNLMTWLFGLPSSSSHALFGGLIGAAVVGIGFHAVDLSVLLSKVILPAVLAPLIAGGVAYLCTKLAYAITRRTDPDSGDKMVQKRGGFRYAQVFSSSLVSLAHGTNDAQKTMGVITLVLISANMQAAGTGPAFWVVGSCALAIALGTYTGGWRIIRTLGSGLTDVKPAQGFAAETSTAAAILASSHLGFALSTTHVASGSVVGSGLGRKGSTVRWRAIGKIALGWVFTLPAAAIVGGFAAFVAGFGTVGVLIDAVLGLSAILLIFFLSQRERVDHRNAISEVGVVGKAVSIPTKKQRQRQAARAKAARKAALKAAQKSAAKARVGASAGASKQGPGAKRPVTAGGANDTESTKQGAARRPSASGKQDGGKQTASRQGASGQGAGKLGASGQGAGKLGAGKQGAGKQGGGARKPVVTGSQEADRQGSGKHAARPPAVAPQPSDSNSPHGAGVSLPAGTPSATTNRKDQP